MRKLVNWGSPKQYQSAWKDFVRSVPAKRKCPCKRLKGDHKFGIWKNHRFPWNKDKPTGWWERFCVGCNKKETWFAPHLPGPFWESDLNARPPGEYEEYVLTAGK